MGNRENFARAEIRIRKAIIVTRSDNPHFVTRLVNEASLLRFSLNPAKKAKAGDWKRTRKAAEEAVDLMPLNTSQSLDRSDQKHIIALFAGLASKTCALVLQDDVSAEAAFEKLDKAGDLSWIFSSMTKTAYRP